MARFVSLVVVGAFALAGCSPQQHLADVQAASDKNLTVGNVQREIKIGMSGADVIAVLGSPNIVSTDENRNEVFVYDKISTEVAYSRSSGGIAGLVFGPKGGGLGAASQNSGAASKSQRTLTVIIKFDKDGKVRDFSYHSSRF